VVLAVGALVALSGACGNGAATGGTGPGGGTTSSGTTTSSSSGAGTGSSSSSASSTSSGSAACNLPGPTGKAYVGTVELGHITIAPGMDEYSALGDLVSAPATAPPTCAGMQMGACCYSSPSTMMPPTLQSAGTLTISDGATNIATLTSYVATNVTLPTLTWTPGSTLKVAASGATVDAFNLSVVAPALLAGITPAFSSTTPITVTTSVDLVVSWTPSNQACSLVEFSLGQSLPTLPSIGCVVDDSVGTLTVPHALLSQFTATTGTATIERAVAAGTTVANANVKLVAIDGYLANVKFMP
jgi:hypothetical protein